MASFSPGEVFLGKYRIEKVLGQGGMGLVVAARHLELDELVAVKFLHATFATQPEQVERFLREGRAAVKIRSEHVARVRDVGKTDDGAPYMIMEHLVGTDLGEHVKDHGPVPVPDAVEYVLQACEALAEAHSSGIVHRDLKPANLFLTERADGSPCVKVLDFGISKLLSGVEGAGLTATNGMMGSPLYMAPEQLNSAKNVDARVDIWALGVILFELITADRPFCADSLPQLVFAVATEAPRKLRELAPDAPAGLEAVVAQCLEKKPDLRPADVGALAKLLEPWAPVEALPSIERINRVIAGSTNPGARRTRTQRTLPNPESSIVEPLSAAEAAPTVATSGGAPSTAGRVTNGSVALSTTNAASVRTAPPPSETPPKGRGATIAVVAALAAIAVAVGVVLTHRGEPSGSASASEPAKPASAPSVTVTPQPAASTPAPSKIDEPPAPASASPSASSAPSIAPEPTAKTAPTTKPPAHAPTHATVKPSATTKPAPTQGTAKPSCDPPYVIDSEGHKKYKMECL